MAHRLLILVAALCCPTSAALLSGAALRVQLAGRPRCFSPSACEEVDRPIPLQARAALALLLGTLTLVPLTFIVAVFEPAFAPLPENLPVGCYLSPRFVSAASSLCRLPPPPEFPSSQPHLSKHIDRMRLTRRGVCCEAWGTQQGREIKRALGPLWRTTGAARARSADARTG